MPELLISLERLARELEPHRGFYVVDGLNEEKAAMRGGRLSLGPFVFTESKANRLVVWYIHHALGPSTVVRHPPRPLTTARGGSCSNMTTAILRRSCRHLR